MSTEATTPSEPLTTDEVSAYAEWKAATFEFQAAQQAVSDAQKRYQAALVKLTDVVIAAKKQQ